MASKNSILLLFFILIFQNGYSQCPPVLDQSQWTTFAGSPENDRWQSFTAGISGDLSKVEVKASGGVTATIILSIYAGTGTGGSLLFSDTYMISETGTTPTLKFDIPCNQMPVINAGSVYTLRFQGNFSAIYNSTNPYPGGSYYSIGGGAQPNTDLSFRTYVSDPNKPVATLSPTNVSCFGGADGSVTANVSSGTPIYTYNWSPSGQTTSTATGLMAGNHSLIITDAVGCNSCEVSQILTSPPAITADAGLDQTFCEGDFPIPLNGNVSGATGGIWTGGGGTFTPNSSTLNALYTPSLAELSAGIVTLVLNTTGNGPCSTVSDAVTFNLYLSPTVNAGSDLNICDGNTIVMTGTGSAVTYTWDSGVSDGIGFVPLVGNYTYIVTGTDANSCTNSDTANVTVNPLPTPGLVSSAGNVICSGDVVNFTASGATSYEFFINGSSVQGPSAASAYSSSTLSNNDQVYVVGTTAGCSGSSSTITFTVNALPNATFSAIPDICDNVGLYTLVEGAPAGGIYSGAGVTGSSFDPASISAGFHTLTYTYTDGNGCTDIANQNIQVLSSPTIVASANTAICNGDNTTITVTGGFSYTWDNGLGAGASHTVSPISNTQYTVTGTGGNGCMNADSVQITVNPLPIVNFGTLSDICISSSPYTLIEGTPAGGNYSGIGVSGGGIFTPSTAGLGTHTLYYNYTDGGTGCTNIDSSNILVYSSPTVVASASALSLCDGDPLTLTGSGALSYTWDNGALDGVSFIPAVGTTTYTVTGTDANSCSGTDQVTVTVNSLPIINGGVDQTACEGDMIVLSASGGTSYSWNNGVTDSQPFSAVAGSTLYIVTGTDANNCSNYDSVIVDVSLTPILTVSNDQYFCAGDSVILNASGATTYNWDSGSSTSPIYILSPTNSETITVIGTTAGCSSSEDIELTLDDPSLVTAGNDQEVCPGFMVFLNASGGVDYSWNGPGIDNSGEQNINLTVDTTAYYHVVITTANDCEYSDSVLVTSSLDPNCSIEPITTITPNGDGRNDSWLIQGIEAFYDNKVTIYNRWGDIVFEASNYDNDLVKWDGTNLLNNPAGTGTYFYLIEITNGTSTTGWVQLLK